MMPSSSIYFKLFFRLYLIPTLNFQDKTANIIVGRFINTFAI